MVRVVFIYAHRWGPPYILALLALPSFWIYLFIQETRPAEIHLDTTTFFIYFRLFFGNFGLPGNPIVDCTCLSHPVVHLPLHGVRV